MTTGGSGSDNARVWGRRVRDSKPDSSAPNLEGTTSEWDLGMPKDLAMNPEKYLWPDVEWKNKGQ